MNARPASVLSRGCPNVVSLDTSSLATAVWIGSAGARTRHRNRRPGARSVHGALLRDPGVSAVACAPGNAGIADTCALVPLDGGAVTGPSVVAAAQVFLADLVVIGPEAPLVAGVADAVRAAGFACFGPTAAAAQLEGSKAFAKDVMAAAGVPTAAARVCTTVDEAAAALDEFGAPYVVKDDGLAAGKGVVVTSDRDAALAHAAGCERVVIEEFLDGRPGSVAVRRHRRHGRFPAAARAGFQADRRRRHRAQHRWHGRVRTTDLAAQRHGQHDHGHRRTSHAGDHGRARNAVLGVALRRPRDDREGPAGGGVQLPLRRPGNAVGARFCSTRPSERC